MKKLSDKAAMDIDSLCLSIKKQYPHKIPNDFSKIQEYLKEKVCKRLDEVQECFEEEIKRIENIVSKWYEDVVTELEK